MTTRSFRDVGRCSRYSGVLLIAIASLAAACAQSAHAQAGLLDALKELDVNDNGYLEPDEITPLSRPYLERITERSWLSLYRPLELEDIQNAARLYHASQNGAWGLRVRAEPELTVKPFGIGRDETMVPEFGIGEVKYPYTPDDLEEAEDTLYYYDRDRDGYLDARESRRVRWTHRDPFDDDVNKDGRLSKLELTQRYARRRLLENESGELMRQSYRKRSTSRSSRNSEPRIDPNQWWREGGSAFWLTASLIGRFDANKNGRLDGDEPEALSLPIMQADENKDGEISRDELFGLMSRLQNEAGDESVGLPGWFFERDTDEDGQLAMNEYATEWSATQLEEFDLFDLNNDGLLTSSEVLRSKAAIGGSYRNEKATLLPPRRTVISEIEVTDEFVIADIDVQLSITHTNVGHLDGYLTGPDGTRVELFSGVGGSGDHFDKTIFDNEETGTKLTKARAPFEGRYRPEEKDNGKPGLAAFYGKPITGVWQLVIRGTRNDRFGMLHTWGLTVKTDEDRPGLLGADDEKGEETTDESESDSNRSESGESDESDTERGSGNVRSSGDRRDRTRGGRKELDASYPDVRAKIEASQRVRSIRESKETSD